MTDRACPRQMSMLDARHRYRLGDSLAVELPTLTRTALVRIQVPQPSHRSLPSIAVKIECRMALPTASRRQFGEECCATDLDRMDRGTGSGPNSASGDGVTGPKPRMMCTNQIYVTAIYFYK